MRPVTIIAAADGSALGNPGPAGWGWYVDESCWAVGGWAHATNNILATGRSPKGLADLRHFRDPVH